MILFNTKSTLLIKLPNSVLPQLFLVVGEDGIKGEFKVEVIMA